MILRMTIDPRSTRLIERRIRRIRHERWIAKTLASKPAWCPARWWLRLNAAIENGTFFYRLESLVALQMVVHNLSRTETAKWSM